MIGERADEQWVITPKHRLRWDAVQSAISGWTPGRLMEFGAGTGEFTARLAALGFDVVCWDPGEENRRAAGERLANVERATVVDAPPPPDASFDVVAAFEVLEHVEDDEAALADWLLRLRPGGHVIVSVPAHMRAWTPDDDRVGHVRRYEKRGLTDLLTGAGLHEVEVRCWGFPLGNVTRRVNALLSRFEGRDDLDDLDAESRSVVSGHRRSPSAIRTSRLVTDVSMRPFEGLQRLFFGADLGDGFVATARRPV